MQRRNANQQEWKKKKRNRLSKQPKHRLRKRRYIHSKLSGQTSRCEKGIPARRTLSWYRQNILKYTKIQCRSFHSITCRIREEAAKICTKLHCTQTNFHFQEKRQWMNFFLPTSFVDWRLLVWPKFEMFPISRLFSSDRSCLNCWSLLVVFALFEHLIYNFFIYFVCRNVKCRCNNRA